MGICIRKPKCGKEQVECQDFQSGNVTQTEPSIQKMTELTKPKIVEQILDNITSNDQDDFVHV